jgi:hypothetical protein
MISHTQAVRLLAYLAAFDQRPFDESAPEAWMDVAADRRWTYDEAMSAVRALVLDPAPRARRIGPAEVAEVIRQRRNEAHERRDAEEARARRDALRTDPETVAARQAAIQSGVAGIVRRAAVEAGVGEVDAIMGWSPLRRLALSSQCPACRAAEQMPCESRGARRQRALQEPHPSRAALTVACPTCGVLDGALCRDEHPHPDRVAAAQRAVTAEAAS